MAVLVLCAVNPLELVKRQHTGMREVRKSALIGIRQSPARFWLGGRETAATDDLQLVPSAGVS